MVPTWFQFGFCLACAWFLYWLSPGFYAVPTWSLNGVYGIPTLDPDWRQLLGRLGSYPLFTRFLIWLVRGVDLLATRCLRVFDLVPTWFLHGSAVMPTWLLLGSRLVPTFQSTSCLPSVYLVCIRFVRRSTRLLFDFRVSRVFYFVPTWSQIGTSCSMYFVPNWFLLGFYVV